MPWLTPGWLQTPASPMRARLAPPLSRQVDHIGPGLGHPGYCHLPGVVIPGPRPAALRPLDRHSHECADLLRRAERGARTAAMRRIDPRRQTDPQTRGYVPLPVEVGRGVTLALVVLCPRVVDRRGERGRHPRSLD